MKPKDTGAGPSRTPPYVSPFAVYSATHTPHRAQTKSLSPTGSRGSLDSGSLASIQENQDSYGPKRTTRTRSRSLPSAMPKPPSPPSWPISQIRLRPLEDDSDTVAVHRGEKELSSRNSSLTIDDRANSAPGGTGEMRYPAPNYNYSSVVVVDDKNGHRRTSWFLNPALSVDVENQLPIRRQKTLRERAKESKWSPIALELAKALTAFITGGGLSLLTFLLAKKNAMGGAPGPAPAPAPMPTNFTRPPF